MTTHELKVDRAYYDAVATGDKPFEVRRNDRGFQRGDELILREYDADALSRIGDRGAFTGRSLRRVVAYVYSGDPRFGGIEPGFVVLGLVYRPGTTPPTSP